MKNMILVILLLLFAIGGASYTIVNLKVQKNAELEKLVRKEEAKQKTAEANKKTAEAQKASEALRAKAAKNEADAKQAEFETAQLEKQREKDARARMEAEAKKRQAEKETAEANARRESDVRKKVEAEKAAAEAKRDAALADAARKEADLRLAETARQTLDLDVRRKNADNKAEELKKLELDKKLAEVEELRETLRKREEASRPDRTLNDLLDETERRRAEEEAAAEAKLREQEEAVYEAQHAARRHINRFGVAAPRSRPLTSAEKILSQEEGRLADVQAKKYQYAREHIISMIEPAIREALREGRKEDANYLYESLRLIVPDYKPKRKEQKAVAASSKQE